MNLIQLKFLKINYGNFLLFNQTLPHGNVVNKTKETRISLNCRFKGLFTPYSQKKLGGFFSPISIRPASKIGIKYKFPFCIKYYSITNFFVMVEPFSDCTFNKYKP